MSAVGGSDDCPLVVHIIPSPLGRGAQRAARILVDRLDDPGVVRHLLMGLFDGPPEVRIDVALGIPGGDNAAEGFQPHVALRLRRALARLGPAVVVAHGGDAMKYALPALIGTRRPVAYYVIGTYAGPSTPRREWVWRRLMALADLVVAVGDEVLEECTDRFGVPRRRAVVIPNGRDQARFHPRPPGAPTAPATLVFVGAMTPQKQPDRFMDVVAHLRAEGRTFRAVMIGDGPLAGRLAAAAQPLHIDFLGSRADVPALLRQSDVLVFTSRPTGEGMPGVLIEAGMSGLPAVSTPVPGARTVLAHGSTGVIVDDDVSAMAEAVGQLLDDQAQREAMGTAARNRCVSEFTLDLMAERWRVALQSMLLPQEGAARRGWMGPGRNAISLRRLRRTRRGSSHS